MQTKNTLPRHWKWYKNKKSRLFTGSDNKFRNKFLGNFLTYFLTKLQNDSFDKKKPQKHKTFKYLVQKSRLVFVGKIRIRRLKIGCCLESVQDFLIKLDMKSCMHLVETSIFSLNTVIVRPTQIMNRADKNWAHF